MKNHWEEILVVGGEGGSIKLYGSKTAIGDWIYSTEKNESALIDFFDDEDLKSVAVQKSKVVSNWEEAIYLLGPYWMNLYPIHVHPAFKLKVWEEVNKQEEVRSLSRWKRLCVRGE
ncbi:hypothetical protein SAMN05880501_11652 [Ureibacillus xyleni]|uniref:Uncharacterized protein n=1 Tax=Ureibacillus xyleni TaxID=614648 RepID=A0A285TMV2_9BACL|nr:hypothetical protein [Ureibacillus xyleni]SOC23957.1 hypothetical protein SAMN05880501_11652 [Ureibacillus xyleni]